MRGVSGWSSRLQIGNAIFPVNAARETPAYLLPLRRRYPQGLRIAAVFNSDMASPQRTNNGDETKGTAEVKKEDKGKSPPPPPLQPPEKPLPGDCCGSGCVRCVWDVYYEELEAYNKSISSNKRDQ